MVSKVEAFDLLLKAEGFKNTHIHNKFKEIFEIEEKDTWNLADCDSVDYPDLLRTRDIKTFIQKVKEDLDTKGTCAMWIVDVKEIIDKRAGKLA